MNSLGTCPLTGMAPGLLVVAPAAGLEPPGPRPAKRPGVDPARRAARLIRACWNLGTADGWHRLRRYAHQYGHGGYITTKSRGFSVTYTLKRLERVIWRRTQGFPHLWDEQQADLVVCRLGYHATGWITTGDALLANSAADAARRRTHAHDYAADDQGATVVVLPTAA
jgi:hypothetical protein